MKKIVYDVILYLVVFAAIQIIVSLAGGFIFGMAVESPLALVVVSATSSILTLALFLWRKWTPVGSEFIKSRPWAILTWSTLAALGVVIPSVWLQEQLPELPDTAGDILAKIISGGSGV